MATYRIIKRRLRFDDKEIYHVERKVLCFWLDILNNSFILGVDGVANYKGWFSSKEEAMAIIDKLMQPKKKRKEVVWTNDPQPKMNY
jgi:pyridoxal/pyridoxine/pyridoxamine kinase